MSSEEDEIIGVASCENPDGCENPDPNASVYMCYDADEDEYLKLCEICKNKINVQYVDRLTETELKACEKCGKVSLDIQYKPLAFNNEGANLCRNCSEKY